MSACLYGSPVETPTIYSTLASINGDIVGICAGAAYYHKYFSNNSRSPKIICSINANMLQEGIIFESLNFASTKSLSNFVLIIDFIDSQISELEAIKIVKGFGCEAFECTCESDLIRILSLNSSKPTAILLNSELNFDKYHETILEMPEYNKIKPVEPKRNFTAHANTDFGQEFSTRKAYGVGLCNLYQSTGGKVIALDSDVKNSTFSILFQQKHPENFIECFISEQVMVSVATGIDLACNGEYAVFCSTFATFLNRSAHQIRSAVLLGSNLNLCGSHVGVSIGQDGPSQMGLEDMSLFYSLKDANKESDVSIFYPSDAHFCQHAVYNASSTKGVCFIRTSRPDLPILNLDNMTCVHNNLTICNKVDPHPKSMLIASGTSLHHALALQEKLTEHKVMVVDPFSDKTFDTDGLLLLLKDHANSLNSVIAVEDHYEFGGVGEHMKNLLMGSKEFLKDVKFVHLCVKNIPRSGGPSDLEKLFKVDSSAILEVLESS